MKNSENFKTLWWGILVIVVGYYLFARYPKLIEGTPSYFDTIVFLVWIGVCLAPIFQEIDIFGVKLKQQIEDLKKDMNRQLYILKTEITSSFAVSAANNNQIYVNTNEEPPKDSEIPALLEQIKNALSKQGISADTTLFENGTDQPVEVEMIQVRLAFE